mgnify:CR=1 FL=1
MGERYVRVGKVRSRGEGTFTFWCAPGGRATERCARPQPPPPWETGAPGALTSPAPPDPRREAAETGTAPIPTAPKGVD